MSAAVGAALLHCRTLAVLLAALHAGCCEAAGLLRSRAVALLHPLHRLQELAAGQTLVVLFGKEWLEDMRKRKRHMEALLKSPRQDLCKQARLRAATAQPCISNMEPVYIPTCFFKSIIPRTQSSESSKISRDGLVN